MEGDKKSRWIYFQESYMIVSISKGYFYFDGKKYDNDSISIEKHTVIKNKWNRFLKFLHLPYIIIDIIYVNGKRVCNIEKKQKKRNVL